MFLAPLKIGFQGQGGDHCQLVDNAPHPPVFSVDFAVAKMPRTVPEGDHRQLVDDALPPASKPRFSMTSIRAPHPISVLLLALLFICCVIAFSGCSVARPYAHERITTTDTNGVVTVNDRTMKTTTASLWPSKSEIEKQTVSAGRSWRIGQEGIDVETTGGTNGVAALREINSILSKVRP